MNMEIAGFTKLWQLHIKLQLLHKPAHCETVSSTSSNIELYMSSEMLRRWASCYQRFKMSQFLLLQVKTDLIFSRDQLKCDGTRAETRFRLSAKRTSPFKSAGASVQSTTGSRGVHISGSNAGYAMFRSSVKSTGYPLHSSVFPSLPLPCVTVCHHISIGVYHFEKLKSRIKYFVCSPKVPRF
jgi:hypothetical protein